MDYAERPSTDSVARIQDRPGEPPPNKCGRVIGTAAPRGFRTPGAWPAVSRARCSHRAPVSLIGPPPPVAPVWASREQFPTRPYLQWTDTLP